MIMMYIDAGGQVRKEIIEIKPYKESVATPKMTERDARALLVNEAKWRYAADWASRNGATFRVITERTMFRQKSKKAIGSTI